MQWGPPASCYPLSHVLSAAMDFTLCNYEPQQTFPFLSCFLSRQQKKVTNPVSSVLDGQQKLQEEQVHYLSQG